MDSHRLSTVILSVTLVAALIGSLFFTIGKVVEKDVVDNQTNLLVANFTENLGLLPKDLKLSLRDKVLGLVPPDMADADAKVADNNSKLQDKAFMVIAIMLALGFGAVFVIWRHSKGKSDGMFHEFDIKAVLKENFIMILFVAFTELLFTFTIMRNFRSADPNVPKLAIVQTLQNYAETCDPGTGNNNALLASLVSNLSASSIKYLMQKVDNPTAVQFLTQALKSLDSGSLNQIFNQDDAMNLVTLGLVPLDKFKGSLPMAYIGKYVMNYCQHPELIPTGMSTCNELITMYIQENIKATPTTSEFMALQELLNNMSSTVISGQDKYTIAYILDQKLMNYRKVSPTDVQFLTLEHVDIDLVVNMVRHLSKNVDISKLDVAKYGLDLTTSFDDAVLTRSEWVNLLVDMYQQAGNINLLTSLDTAMLAQFISPKTVINDLPLPTGNVVDFATKFMSVANKSSLLFALTQVDRAILGNVTKIFDTILPLGL